MNTLVLARLPDSTLVGGLDAAQASIAMTLQNANNGGNDATVMDDAQLVFWTQQLLAFFQHSIPTESANVYHIQVEQQQPAMASRSRNRHLRVPWSTPRCALAAANSNGELQVSGYLEGSKLVAETSTKFAQRLNAALASDHTVLVDNLKFELGITGNHMKRDGRYQFFWI